VKTSTILIFGAVAAAAAYFYVKSKSTQAPTALGTVNNVITQLGSIFGSKGATSAAPSQTSTESQVAQATNLTDHMF